MTTNKAIADWINQHYLDLMGFHDAFERMADMGKVDSPGGAEYQRILADWISEGCPSDIEGYIHFAQSREMSLVLAFNFGIIGQEPQCS